MAVIYDPATRNKVTKERLIRLPLAQLRESSHRGTVRDYVPEFMLFSRGRICSQSIAEDFCTGVNPHRRVKPARCFVHRRASQAGSNDVRLGWSCFLPLGYAPHHAPFLSLSGTQPLVPSIALLSMESLEKQQGVLVY